MKNRKSCRKNHIINILTNIQRVQKPCRVKTEYASKQKSCVHSPSFLSLSFFSRLFLSCSFVRVSSKRNIKCAFMFLFSSTRFCFVVAAVVVVFFFFLTASSISNQGWEYICSSLSSCHFFHLQQ